MNGPWGVRWAAMWTRYTLDLAFRGLVVTQGTRETRLQPRLGDMASKTYDWSGRQDKATIILEKLHYEHIYHSGEKHKIPITV